MLGDDSSLTVSVHASADKDVTDVLDSPLSSVYPGFNMSLDVSMKGQALNNLLRAQLK